MLQWIIGFGYRMAKSCDSGFAVVYYGTTLRRYWHLDIF